MTRDKKLEKKNSREFRRERNQSQQPSSKQAQQQQQQQQSLMSLFLCFFFLFSYSCVYGRTKILYIAKEEEEEEDGYNNQCKKKMHNIVSFGSDDLKASSRIFLKICNKNRINSQSFFFVIKLVKMAAEEFW
jgi:hypothetical protein